MGTAHSLLYCTAIMFLQWTISWGLQILYVFQMQVVLHIMAEMGESACHRLEDLVNQMHSRQGSQTLPSC